MNRLWMIVVILALMTGCEETLDPNDCNDYPRLYGGEIITQVRKKTINRNGERCFFVDDDTFWTASYPTHGRGRFERSPK